MKMFFRPPGLAEIKVFKIIQIHIPAAEGLSSQLFAAGEYHIKAFVTDSSVVTSEFSTSPLDVSRAEIRNRVIKFDRFISLSSS